MTKIIFLDVDGVLNSNVLWDEHKRLYELTGNQRKFPEDDIDHDACVLLKLIVSKTNAKVVISSTWRFNYYDFLVQHLKKYDIDVIGKTGRGCSECVRGNAILTWLKDNKELVGDYWVYKNYVILDDDSDMLYWQKDNFVHINNDTGLTNDYVDSIISILNQGE